MTRLPSPAPVRFVVLIALFAVFVGGCELFDNRDDVDDGGPLLPRVLPAPSGAFFVGTTTRHFTDQSREETYTTQPGDPRELVVQFWYPADAAPVQNPAPYMDPPIVELFAAIQDYTTPDSMRTFVNALRTNSLPDAPMSTVQATYPVVFFSHGLTGVRAVETTYIEELASHGYVVVGIDHTFGSLGTVFPDGRVVTFAANQPPFEQIVNIWARDLSFVLDELEQLNAGDPAGLFTGRVDLERVGAMGHSTGGSAAAEVHVFDRRFKAGLSLDAPQVGAAATQGLDEPFMLLFADPSDYLDTAVQSRLRGRGYAVTIAGTTHYSFTDLPTLIDFAGVSQARAAASNRPPGTLTAGRNRDILNTFMVAFFDRHLRGQPSPLLAGDTQAFPEVTLEIINSVSTPVAAF